MSVDLFQNLAIIFLFIGEVALTWRSARLEQLFLELKRGELEGLETGYADGPPSDWGGKVS